MPAVSRLRQQGFTLIEISISLLVMALLLGTFAMTASTVFETRDAALRKEALTRDAMLAMQRMVGAVSEAPHLLVPLADDPASVRNEAVRAQRVPAAPGQENDTAVLALRLGPNIDRDADGVPDADNDGDGRIDEDPGKDLSNDSHPGIQGIDDDFDGNVDEGILVLANDDDDEDGTQDEDPADGDDDDGDLSVDEDPQGDLNGDGFPGIAGIDDDGDGQIDEGDSRDDDEDGSLDEDWYDPVVFYLDNGRLIERQPFPDDVSGDGKITGADFFESVIADRVSYFRVERLDRARGLLIDITLELSDPAGGLVRLQTRVGVGGPS